ncbi:MAG: translation elongation factor Ts [Propionibacteriaceae bacterium]|jgi:elongation factor Ts|nr:translation elongation factor Ts [Propionibacteriaceae bacterium]
MTITAADVKALRDKTGVGMMDAKKALEEATGDVERAIEILRVTGAAKAAKRNDREAKNGIVATHGHALIKLAAETDFVAKNAEFVALADRIAQAVDQAHAEGTLAANAIVLDGDNTVDDTIAALVAKIGEKIELAEVAWFSGATEAYLHHRSKDLPPQVGVLVEYEGHDADFVHSVALQIASMSPLYVTRDEIPEAVLEKERRIAAETAREEGKPDAMIPRIVEGRINAFYKDVVLEEQASLSDEKVSVGKQAAAAGVKITRFVRFAAAS